VSSHIKLIFITYCDMTPESRNSPLLTNSSLTHVSAATNKKQNNTGIVRHGDLYSARLEVIKELVQSSFAREPSFESSVQLRVQ
jgi:phosphoribosylformylglycinamidine (FGAM) synthase-like amidotransferase family enzyme